MKKTILLALVFLLGCASGSSGMLRFQDRELLIHPDKPGLAYPYKETVYKKRKFWKILGKKKVTEQRMDFYDLNKKSVRDKLRNAVFTCKSKMRFKY